MENAQKGSTVSGNSEPERGKGASAGATRWRAFSAQGLQEDFSEEKQSFSPGG
jgi:hypothetical protein